MNVNVERQRASEKLIISATMMCSTMALDHSPTDQRWLVFKMKLTQHRIPLHISLTRRTQIFQINIIEERIISKNLSNASVQCASSF